MTVYIIKKTTKDLCKNAFLWLFALLMIAALSAVYSGVGRHHANNPQASDFYKFYLSGVRLQNLESMYWSFPDKNLPESPCNPKSEHMLDLAAKDSTEILQDEDLTCLHPNLNPPIFSAIAWPLSKLEYSDAWWTWSLCSLAFAAISLILVLRENILNTKDLPLPNVLIMTGFFAYFPTLACYIYGQITLLLLPFLVLSWLAMRRGKYFAAGAWIGVAMSLKPFFGLFIISYLCAKKWGACIASLATVTISLIIGGIIAGYDSYSEYFELLRNITWISASWNASFNGFFLRIFGGFENQPWIYLPSLARALSTIASLSVTALIAHTISKTATIAKNDQADIIYSITTPAMLLLSPLGWLYYFPLLLVSTAILWACITKIKTINSFKLLLLIPISLTMAPRMLLPSFLVNTPLTWFWDAGVNFYALLIILFVGIYTAKTIFRFQQQ